MDTVSDKKMSRLRKFNRKRLLYLRFQQIAMNLLKAIILSSLTACYSFDVSFIINLVRDKKLE